MTNPVMNRIKLHMHIPILLVDRLPAQNTLDPIVLPPLPGYTSLMNTLTMINAMKNPKWIKATTQTKIDGR